MKNIVIVLVFIFACNVQAQNETKKSKSCKITMDVKGNCEMCKMRIEKAALKTKGVKYAVWDIGSKKIQLIFNEYKTSKKEITTSIINVGHDVDTLSANKEVYDKLHFCCQYTR